MPQYDLSKPYIGYRSAGRRPEANNDRTASANAPLSALRGYAAGTAGLPGDIEGLLRSGISQLSPQLLTAFPALRAFGIGSRADPTPQMPTTEFYNEYLPGAQLNATPTGKAFTTAGNLFGGAGSTTLARYGIKSTAELADLAARIAAEAPRSGSRAAQLGVIKMPGGNFLKGDIEDAVRSMKIQPPAISGQILDDAAGTQLFDDYRKFYDAGNSNVGLRQWTEENHPDIYKQLIGKQGAALNNFIDKKIAPYIRNEMATPDDPLRAMAEKYAVDKPVKLAEVQGRIDAFAAKMEQEARDRGVPVGDLTSMRQQMIGLEKEKALLEAREGLHFTPDDESFISHKFSNRDKAGTSPGGMGQSPLARSWEDVSDSAFNIDTAGNILKFKDSYEPWLAKVPPETKVYSTRGTLIDRTGFDHLLDELHNATIAHGKQKELDSWLKLAKTPEEVAAAHQAFVPSLPANLHIDPADLGKLTMPQAVDRVADINAWRATQKAEADLLKANNAATQVVKEYPEQGLKWVELSNSGHSMDKLPEGWSLQEFEGSSPGSKIFGVVDSKGHLHPEAAGKHPETPEIAYENFKKGFGVKELEAALKYEGDTMQHCVGGYCPDVLEGRSRIYSLRDNKGQPRVTIEVETTNHLDFNKWWDQQTPQKRLEIDQRAAGNGLQAKLKARIESPEYLADMADLPPSITQIKGFKNKKPADEYLPMVQDFVKSGNWSDVRDLRNADMRRTLDAFNSNELKMIQDAGLEVPTWASGEDIQRLHNSITPEGQRLKYDSRGQVVGREDEYLDPTQYAQGGFVSNHFDPIKIKQIIASLDDDYDPENIQQIIAQRESAYA